MSCNKISQWEMWWILQEICFMCHRAGVVHLRTGDIVSCNNGIMSLAVLTKWHFPHLLVCQATAFFPPFEVQPEYISFYSSVKVFLPFQLVLSTPEKERGRGDKTSSKTTLNSVLNTKKPLTFRHFQLVWVFFEVERLLLDYLIWPWLALIY